MKINRERMSYRIAFLRGSTWEEVAAGWNYAWAKYIVDNLPPDENPQVFAIIEKGTDKILYRTDKRRAS